MTTDETAAGRRLSLALMLLVALGTLRGGGTSLAKYVSINDVPPIGYAMWQSTFAAALLLLFGTVRSGSKLPPRDRWGYFAVTGLVGTALPNCIFFFVVRQVPAGTMAVLLTLGPVITYGLAAATRLERLDPVRSVGIGMGLGGALIIALSRVDTQIGVNWYTVMALSCPLCYSIAAIFVAHRPISGIQPIHLAAGTQLAAASLLWPLALATGHFYPIWSELSLQNLLIAVHGIIASLAYIMFFRIVALAGAVFYSYSSYLIAATGIGWGMLIFGERHGIEFALAVALIFAGLAVVNSRQSAAS